MLCCFFINKRHFVAAVNKTYAYLIDIFVYVIYALILREKKQEYIIVMRCHDFWWQRISIGYLPALVTIISVPSESNSSHSDFISSCAPTPSNLGWSGLSGLTLVVAVLVDSPGVVFPSPVVSEARSTSDWTPGDGVLDRCCRSPELDDDSSEVLHASSRPARVLTPSDDDVKQSVPAALDKYAVTTPTTTSTDSTSAPVTPASPQDNLRLTQCFVRGGKTTNGFLAAV